MTVDLERMYAENEWVIVICDWAGDVLGAAPAHIDHAGETLTNLEPVHVPITHDGRPFSVRTVHNGHMSQPAPWERTDRRWYQSNHPWLNEGDETLTEVTITHHNMTTPSQR